MSLLIAQSALKHGLNEDEIDYAYNHCLKSRTIQRIGNVNNEVDLLLCFLEDGRMCELVATLAYDEENVFIFHAMTPPTKEFSKQLEGKSDER